MPVAYRITKSGALSRSAKSLMEDKDIKIKMRKTSEAFSAVTKRMKDECVKSEQNSIDQKIAVK